MLSSWFGSTVVSAHFSQSHGPLMISMFQGGGVGHVKLDDLSEDATPASRRKRLFFPFRLRLFGLLEKMSWERYLDGQAPQKLSEDGSLSRKKFAVQGQLKLKFLGFRYRKGLHAYSVYLSFAGDHVIQYSKRRSFPSRNYRPILQRGLDTECWRILDSGPQRNLQRFGL